MNSPRRWQINYQNGLYLWRITAPDEHETMPAYGKTVVLLEEHYASVVQSRQSAASDARTTALTEAVEAIRNVHVPYGTIGEATETECSNCGEMYPCESVRAVSALLTAPDTADL